LKFLRGRIVIETSIFSSTAMKFRPKFFWNGSFFDQNQQPLKSVEPFERILRALFISPCPYKFFSFLNRRNTSHRFRLFSRDFPLFSFFFPGFACFPSLASARNLPSWVKYYEKLESFGKEFWWTEFIAVARVRNCLLQILRTCMRTRASAPLQAIRASLLPPSVCVPAVLGALAVWIQNQKKKCIRAYSQKERKKVFRVGSLLKGHAP